MLNGIPEVALGINTKLLNIERTEAAKRILVNNFIQKDKEERADNTEKRRLETDAKVFRGGQEFTDQFYSQHQRYCLI